jgi:hypothetical protein
MRATGLVAAGVVAGGVLAGTLGAQAANEGDNVQQAGTANVHEHRGGPGGPRGLGGPGGGADLAEALGVSEDTLQDAFEAIRDDVRPAEKRADGPPTVAERTVRRDKLTAALAKELGLSEAKVEAAFDKVHKAHAADHRENLSERLDAAVDDGKLTKDDKASVLKAFDAGVLGGPGPR